jgi:hypothetical protein
MCEPSHSIVQYDPEDDDNNRFGGTLDFGLVMDKLGRFAKKIGQWFHISKMGAGHSGAQRRVLYLPDPVLYEGEWWNKGNMKLDCRHGPEAGPQFDAGYEYHMRVCMGSMQIFRRFFETSLQETNSLHLYITRFMECVLTSEGRDQLSKRISSIMPGKQILAGKGRVEDSVKDKIIKATMGYTRKRNILVPEWSMDDGFWSR